MRFFFGSVRYSEDMDLDVAVIAPTTLKNKVDRALQAPALLAPLKARGLEVVDVSRPEQTETTQRWKLGLRGEGFVVRTKIEFSRRRPASDADAAVEPVLSTIARSFGTLAPLVRHYRIETAIVQKVAALHGRPLTQARDLFDLHLLLLQSSAKVQIAAKELDAAIDRAMAIGWDDFRAQVVAYLEPEHQALYAERALFEQMQEEVIAKLEELRL